MMPAICVHSSYAKIVCFLIQGILTVLKEGGKPGLNSRGCWSPGLEPSPHGRDASSLTVALLATLAPQQAKLKPFLFYFTMVT